MKRWMAATIFAGILALSVPGAAASLQAGARPVESSQATDFSAQRHYRNFYRHGYRPYYRPAYYARPTYYRPYPYVAPVPFFLGFGFGPSWW